MAHVSLDLSFFHCHTDHNTSIPSFINYHGFLISLKLLSLHRRAKDKVLLPGRERTEKEMLIILELKGQISTGKVFFLSYISWQEFEPRVKNHLKIE